MTTQNVSVKTTMTTLLHRFLRTVWSCFPFTTCTIRLYSGCSSVFTVLLASSVVGSYDLVLVSVVSPFCGRSDRVPVVVCVSSRFSPCRIACILVRACAFDTSRARSSARRSFRNFASVLSFCGSAECHVVPKLPFCWARISESRCDTKW